MLMLTLTATPDRVFDVISITLETFREGFTMYRDY